MPLRLIEITAPADQTGQIRDIADKHDCLDSWYSAKNRDGRRIVKILIRLNDQQKLTDALQRLLSGEKNWRIIVQPVEAVIPKEDVSNNNYKNGALNGTLTREELFNEIWRGAQPDFNFILLVILSTVVCAIGLIQDNVAVIIGAMVIAPLLGPIMALAFGAALGDRGLIIESIKSNFIGFSVTMGMALLTGFVIHAVAPEPLTSKELLDRTEIGYENIALALAAGAAAVLSMATGLSSALVGVMVAVALMPPAVTLGIMAGAQSWDMAYGAALLLITNIVCISLAAQIVFLIKNIKPRTWYERRKSYQSVKINIAFWVALLLALMALIGVRT